MDVTNKLGAVLDGTATNANKYIDRQRAHHLSYRVLLTVLSDHPENEQLEYEYELANEALAKMNLLADKNYPDKNGNI